MGILAPSKSKYTPPLSLPISQLIDPLKTLMASDLSTSYSISFSRILLFCSIFQVASHWVAQAVLELTPGLTAIFLRVRIIALHHYFIPRSNRIPLNAVSFLSYVSQDLYMLHGLKAVTAGSFFSIK